MSSYSQARSCSSHPLGLADHHLHHDGRMDVEEEQGARKVLVSATRSPWPGCRARGITVRFQHVRTHTGLNERADELAAMLHNPLPRAVRVDPGHGPGEVS